MEDIGAHHAMGRQLKHRDQEQREHGTTAGRRESEHKANQRSGDDRRDPLVLRRALGTHRRRKQRLPEHRDTARRDRDGDHDDQRRIDREPDTALDERQQEDGDERSRHAANGELQREP